MISMNIMFVYLSGVNLNHLKTFLFIFFLLFSGKIVSKPVNPFTDNYKAKLNVQTSVREGLQEYKNTADVNRQSTTPSTSSETSHAET